MMKIAFRLFLITAVIAALLPGWAGDGEEKKDLSLSPEKWEKYEYEKYCEMQQVHDFPRPLAEAQKAIIGGTTGPLAVHAGYKVLEAGGTAADAAITTALAQIVLSGGSWNSFAGIFYMVYYDAKANKVYSLNAGYNTVLNETEPATIPPRAKGSGRSVLVPGFMAGVEAAHRRFGRLPWKELFEPAIYLAEKGFPVDSMLGSAISFRRNVFGRSVEGRQIFARPDGRVYRKGDLLRQPGLARTLRNVTSKGAKYMYTGQWAERFVAAVRGAGGKMTLDDLKNYKAEWKEPISTTHSGYEVYTINFPERGALQLLEGLNILERADIKSLDHYWKSPEALFRFIQISRFSHLVTYSKAYTPYPESSDAEWSPANRIKKDSAKHNWEIIKGKNWQVDLAKKLKSDGTHSDAIVAVDKEGNIASVVHSINTLVWGETGLIVDGVSVPDSASFQQDTVKKTGPGRRFPNLVNPVIVFRDGKPVLAASCIGAALHECMLQHLVNVLDYGLDPKQSLATPKFWSPAWNRYMGDKKDYMKQSVMEGDFSAEILDGVRKLGQPIKEFKPHEQGLRVSYWIGVERDPESGSLRGAVSQKFNGIVEGF